LLALLYLLLYWLYLLKRAELDAEVLHFPSCFACFACFALLAALLALLVEAGRGKY
jgi:hypothetical protein